MLKLLGVLLIFTSSLGYAYCIHLDLKNHLLKLYDIRKLLCALLEEERYSLCPVEQILQYHYVTKNEIFAEILHRIGKKLEEKREVNGPVIWKEEFDKNNRKLNLKEEELELLGNAGGAFFGKSMEENEKNLTVYLKQLDFFIETEQRERGEKQKVYQTVSIMCGLILIILLI